MSQYANTSGGHLVPRAKVTATGGIAGAVIGGAISAARNINDLKEEKITKDEAIKNTAKDAAGSGLATAAGIAVAGTLGIGGLGGLLIAAFATTGAKYLWDNTAAGSKKKKA